MSGGLEKILYPVTVPSGSSTFVWTYGGVRKEVTITPGDWLIHAEGAAGFLGSLTLLTAGQGGALLFRAATPRLSIRQHWRGLRIYASDTATAFSIDFDDAAFTLDPRLLGFPSTQSTAVTSAANYTIGANTYHSILSDLTYLGAWHCWSFLSTKGATDRRSRKEAMRSHSGGRASARYQHRWYTETIRTLKYEHVPAAHVKQGRAALLDYAAVGEVAAGDDHNALERLYNVLASDTPCRVVYYDEGAVFDLGSTLPHYEDVLFYRTEDCEALEKVVTTTRKTGEFYEVSLELVVVGGGFEF